MTHLSNDAMMRVIINACDSLNTTRVHELGGATSTITTDVGLLEIGRAVERALLAEQARTEPDLVPGVMHCARCKFRLNRINLNVNVGTVTAGDNKTEPCPNGCGPLWPVTWKQEAEEAMTVAEGLCDRAVAAERELADLRERLGPRAAAQGRASQGCGREESMTDLTKLADDLGAIANSWELVGFNPTEIREAARILRAAAAVDVAGLIELAAKAIYEQWADKPGFVKWVPGGNSHKQTEARDIARAALESALRLALAARKPVNHITMQGGSALSKDLPDMGGAGADANISYTVPMMLKGPGGHTFVSAAPGYATGELVIRDGANVIRWCGRHNMPCGQHCGLFAACKLGSVK